MVLIHITIVNTNLVPDRTSLIGIIDDLQLEIQKINKVYVL